MANDLIEQIARLWDGCTYESVGEDIDIGQAIREAGARLTAPVATEQAQAVAEPVASIMEMVDTLVASMNEAHLSKTDDWKQACFDSADRTIENIRAALTNPTRSAEASEDQSMEHGAKCPALDGYPCCCASAQNETPWNWLRDVINGLPSTEGGYRQLIARHDVLAWIDEGERRALISAGQTANEDPIP